jgi:hypothetical protein
MRPRSGPGTYGVDIHIKGQTVGTGIWAPLVLKRQKCPILILAFFRRGRSNEKADYLLEFFRQMRQSIQPPDRAAEKRLRSRLAFTAALT